MITPLLLINAVTFLQCATSTRKYGFYQPVIIGCVGYILNYAPKYHAALAIIGLIGWRGEFVEDGPELILTDAAMVIAEFIAAGGMIASTVYALVA